MATPDLWGNIQATKVRTPVAILREQAALLGKKTQNVVEGRVNSGTEEDQFFHHFELVVPTLDHYTYSLFTISHGVNLYPVRAPQGKRLENEDEFTDWLRQKLSSRDTIRIVQNLLAQVDS